MDRRRFLRNTFAGAVVAGIGSQISLGVAAQTAEVPGFADAVPGWTTGRWPISGRLRKFPANPRYFTDDSGKAIFLTGCHTWANFQDTGLAPVARLDYPAYIDMMVKHNQNFMRFWHWEQAAWAPWTTDKVLYEPLPYLRTGPGLALDGQPKFDLTKFNPQYFARMRKRLIYARDRDIYAAVQLFQSFSANKKPLDYYCGDPWRGHPYNASNNINGFHGGLNSTGTVNLNDPAVRKIQAAYIAQAIETVNDLDNVLYEVINEGGNKDWDWWVVDFVHQSEEKKGRVHPVGLTGYDAESFASMLESRCDWASPSSTDGEFYKNDPPAWGGKKVVVLDTDHIWGVGGNPLWAWKSFCRGYNTLFMDPWMPGSHETPCNPQSAPPGDPTRIGDQPWIWEPTRKAMGNTRTYAQRMNLAAMTPHDELSASRYCLANPGEEYLIFLPEGYEVKVDLSGAKQTYNVEWMHPVAGTTMAGGTVKGGHKVDFVVPFSGPATLYLSKA